MKALQVTSLSTLLSIVGGLTAALLGTSANAQWDCTSMKRGSTCVGCTEISQAHWKQYGYPQCLPSSEFCFSWLAPPATLASTSLATSELQSAVSRCNDDPVVAAASRAFAVDHWFFNVDVAPSVVSQISSVNPAAASTLLTFSRMRNFPGDKRHGTVGFGSLPTSASVALELQNQADHGDHAIRLPEGQGVAVEFRSERRGSGDAILEFRSYIVTGSGTHVRDVGTPVRIEAAMRRPEFVEFRTLGLKQVDQLEVLQWSVAR